MDLIEIGQIVNTHGIKGEIKVNPWVDDLDEFLDFEAFFYKKNGEYIELTAESIRFHKNCIIIKFDEIDDMTEAEKYKGVILYSEKDINLPDDVYYVGDLIGLSVCSVDRKIGIVREVLKTGANDVYEVEADDGKKYYIPAIKDVVKKIDLDDKTVLINIIDGLLD